MAGPVRVASRLPPRANRRGRRRELTRVYRILRKRYAKTPFNGEGAYCLWWRGHAGRCVTCECPFVEHPDHSYWEPFSPAAVVPLSRARRPPVRPRRDDETEGKLIERASNDLPTNAPQRRRYKVRCRRHHGIFHFVTVSDDHEGRLDGRRSARKVDE